MMEKVSREYKYWDKTITRHENNGFLTTNVSGQIKMYKKQITRSRKKLTEDQYEELINRCDALEKEYTQRLLRRYLRNQILIEREMP